MAPSRRSPRTDIARGFRIAPRDAVNILAENADLAANLIDAVVVDTTSGPDLDPESVRDWMSRRIDNSAVFTRRVRRRRFEMGDPFWIPTTPDLPSQVSVIPARGPGWGPVSEVVASMLDTPLDLGERAWELTVVTGVRELPGLPEEVSVFVLKVHHSAMDGLGIAAVMHSLFSDDPFTESRVAGTPEEPVPGVVDELRRLPAQVRHLCGVMWRRRAQKRTPVFTPNGRGPMRARERGPSTARVVWFDLDQVRAAVRDRPVHLTVNDVVLTVVSLALDSHLRDADTITPSLTAIVPIDIGGLRDNGAANKTTFVTVDLHPEIDDPTERMLSIHADMAARRATAADYESTATDPDPADVLPAVLSRTVAAIGHRLSPAKDRLDITIVSNIPHPTGPTNYGGAPIVGAFHPLPAGGGMAVAHNVTSIGSRLGLTVTAVPGALPDPDAYAERLRDAVGRLGVAAK